MLYRQKRKPEGYFKDSSGWKQMLIQNFNHSLNLNQYLYSIMNMILILIGGIPTIDEVRKYCGRVSNRKTSIAIMNMLNGKTGLASR